jgi:hypothetical protein
MQNYKNLAKNLFAKKKNNFADFAQTTNTLEFVEQLQPKTYYETYKELYFGAKCFAVLAQIATAISSYSFFADLFAAKITNEYALIVCVCVVLIIIEVMKFITLNKALLGLFSLPAKPNYVLLAFALVISLCSIYASVIGGGKLGIDNEQVSTVKSEFDTEIAILRAEITDIQKRNSYKGNTYIAGKEKKLLHQKEGNLTDLQAKKDSELAKVHDLNETNANTFKIGFGLFDIFFLLCSFYVWYFTKLVAIESLANEMSPGPEKHITIENTNVGSQNAPNTQQNAIPNQQNKIGFHYDFTHLKNKAAADAAANLDTNSGKHSKNVENVEKHDENSMNENRKEVNKTYENHIHYNRKCLHCGNNFLHNHKKQKFCADKCRVGAWEQKTKRILKFKPKNVVPSNKPNSLF